MFLAQNVAGGSQQQFPSRDQLLGFLEQENAKVFQSTLPRRERLRNSTQFATKTYRKYHIGILFFSCFSNLIHYFGARPLYIS